MAKVCQLFSGSSGNAIYIENAGHSVLVDIGVSAKRCEGALRQIGVEPASISAVVVTHEHVDHVRGLRVFCSRYGTDVYAPSKCLQYLESHGQLSVKFSARPSDRPFDDGCFHFTPFRLSHDSVDCFGYRIELQNGRCIAVCTDTGALPEEARQVLPGSDLIFLESNHEVDMLKSGPYPYYLKQRILSDRGHLSNAASADFAAQLVESGTTRVVLAHLSRENNMPELAKSAAFSSMEKIGAQNGTDYLLYVSAPENAERPIVL